MTDIREFSNKSKHYIEFPTINSVSNSIPHGEDIDSPLPLTKNQTEELGTGYDSNGNKDVN